VETGWRRSRAPSHSHWGQILSPWLKDIADSGIGMSHQPPRLHRLAGRYDNPLPESDICPQSETTNCYCSPVEKYNTTSGFWPRVRARALRAPVFLGSLPRPSQLRCSPKIKYKLFQETKCLPSGPNSDRQGHIFFHWAQLHPTELRCTLMSYAVPPWTTLHPIELMAMLHPTKLCCTLLSYTAPYLSYAAP
jgi:hypothetical protein